MAVVPLILCKWSYMEELPEVNYPIMNNKLINIGGSLASDDLYLLDLRNGD